MVATGSKFEFDRCRYMNDVFAVIPENCDIQNFVSQINSLSPSLNLELEIKADNC